MRDGINYKCDDCGKPAVFKSYKKARAASWALAKDYKTCYCPVCAEKYRIGAAKKSVRLERLQRYIRRGVG